ncbi:MAG: hypothetical protein HY319_23025 [Armatimonadetes bacterium]|nr:hypothetical protein [Armatimonadota bacterium]
MQRAKAGLELFVISFLALYFEIFCIRWIPAQLSFMGLFTNFVLLACFLGLGLGCLLTWQRRPLVALFPVGFTLLLAAVLLCTNVRIVAHDAEVIFLDYRQAWFDLNLWLALGFFFVIIGLVFTALGQEIGLLFNQLPPVRAYTINIVGSLAGVAAFSLFSLLSLPSWVWVAAGLVVLIFYLMQSRGGTVLAAALGLCSLAMVAHSDRGQIWSPYHKISVSPFQINVKDGNPYPFQANQNPADIKVFGPEAGFNILVNGFFYQQPLNLSDSFVEQNRILNHLRYQYDVPYKVGTNRNVLIVGGGSGNDAAAALRNGAESVHVVDIDPKLVEIGRRQHPEKPYSDPRVRITIADARSIFKREAGREQYDKIAFGLLDSHVQLSSLSNLRIDSFVYTVDSFRDASRLLSPDGIMVVNFTIATPRFAGKLYSMLQQATGMRPVILSNLQPQPLGVTVIAGPGVERLFPDVPPVTTATPPPSTDDWPFFYLLSRRVGGDYLIALGIVLATSTLLVYLAGRARQRGVNLHFFALGAAFMLLESKSITTLALVFGSTWWVNSVVIATVLTMILLANWVVARYRPQAPLAIYVALFCTLALAYLLPLTALEPLPKPIRLLATLVLTFLPILFAGIIFATSFSRTPEPDYALGSNILGGILGGALEYLSMVTGFRLLILLIAALYGVSLLARPLRS